MSVLIPVLNEEAELRDAARSMLGQRFDGAIEFLFVDGRSEDGTAAILRELEDQDSRVRVLDNPRRTTPKALNIGLRAARGEVICRMDAHAHYRPDYVARGVERLRRGGADHVSGPQIPMGHSSWSRRVALALSSRLGAGGAEFRRMGATEFEVDTGFTGLWWRSTLEAQGGWDEGWPSDQDGELAARIRAGGGRLVCLPDMAAAYIPRGSLWRLARQYARYGYYRAKTFRRHPHAMRRSHVLSPGLVLCVAAAALPLGPLARLARAGLVAYAGTVLAVSASKAGEAGERDAAALPAIFVTMHLAWGIGFYAGCARFGPPLRALRRLAGAGSG